MKTALFALTALLLVGCGELERREIHGSPYDATRGCWQENQPTGKFTRSRRPCGQAITHVKDEDGQFWELSSDCGKEKFEPLDTNDPQLDTIQRAPRCAQIE